MSHLMKRHMARVDKNSLLIQSITIPYHGLSPQVLTFQDFHIGKQQWGFDASSTSDFLDDTQRALGYPFKLETAYRGKLPLGAIPPAIFLESLAGKLAVLVSPYCFHLTMAMDSSQEVLEGPNCVYLLLEEIDSSILGNFIACYRIMMTNTN